MKNINEMPVDLRDALGGYGPQLHDGTCGETTGWGYRIIQHLGEDRFRSLGAYGELACSYPSWFLITKRLTPQDAIIQYGAITEIGEGPQGGFKRVTFGEKKFTWRGIDVRQTEYYDATKVVVVRE